MPTNPWGFFLLRPFFRAGRKSPSRLLDAIDFQSDSLHLGIGDDLDLGLGLMANIPAKRLQIADTPEIERRWVFCPIRNGMEGECMIGAPRNVFYPAFTAFAAIAREHGLALGGAGQQQSGLFPVLGRG